MWVADTEAYRAAELAVHFLHSHKWSFLRNMI